MNEIAELFPSLMIKMVVTNSNLVFLSTDEAMHILYNNGCGSVYLTVVRWLDSSSPHLLSTAVLAIGNFARKDDYCIQMMQDHIYDKLLGR